NEHPTIAPYDPLQAADGSIVVAVGNQRLWRRFCDVLDRPDLFDDPRFRSNALRIDNRPALKAEIHAAFGSRRVEELVHLLRGVDVPCGPVRTVAEALDDEQVGARDMLLSVPVEGLGTARVLGNPVKLSDTPSSVRLPPPRLGQHTAEVLAELDVRPVEE
ncbi:MAG: CoA transferase, partial [Vicinamibacterales bacterium]